MRLRFQRLFHSRYKKSWTLLKDLHEKTWGSHIPHERCKKWGAISPMGDEKSVISSKGSKQQYISVACKEAWCKGTCLFSLKMLYSLTTSFILSTIFLLGSCSNMRGNAAYVAGLSTRHGVPKFVFGKLKISLRVTTDSDTVFREKSIGEGFKIVTVAVFEKNLLFEKKNWFIFDRNF